MTAIIFAVESPLPPAAIRDALTDFSARRTELRPNLDPRFYQVHDCGETWADVTEGSAFLRGVWERDRYDWSQPDLVRITVCESNAFAPGSSWEYRIEPNAGGGSRIEVTVRRIGKGAKGRVLALLLRPFGRRIFRADLEKTLTLLSRQDTAPVGERAVVR
jgi:hypothetical protein